MSTTHTLPDRSVNLNSWFRWRFIERKFKNILGEVELAALYLIKQLTDLFLRECLNIHSIYRHLNQKFRSPKTSLAVCM